MFFHALRYRVSPQAPWRFYRIRPGHGPNSATVVFQGDAVSLDEIGSAMRFALTGRSLPRCPIHACTFKMSDRAGQSWTIDREDQRSTLLNGNNVVASGTSVDIKLFDLWHDSDLFPELVVSEQRLKTAHFSIDSSPGGSTRTNRFTTTEAKNDNKLQDELPQLYAKIQKLSGIRQLTNPGNITKLIANLRPVYFEYKSIKAMLEQMDCQDFGNSASTELLENEVNMIKRIETLATPFLAPENNPANVKEKIRVIESNLSKLTEKYADKGSLNITRSTDLRKPLEALARVDAYAKLIRSVQATSRYITDKIDPVVTTYVETIQSSAKQNLEVMGELESCLASLSVTLNSSAPSGSRTWFEKLKKPTESTAEPTSVDLDSARMAVEYVSGRLNDLRENLDNVCKQIPTAGKSLGAIQKNLANAYTSAMEQWTSLADQLGINPDITIKQFLDLLSDHGQVLLLSEELRSLRDLTKRQAESIGQLEESVRNWRRFTKSQKQGELSNAAVLVTEARDIVKYLPVKLEKLDKAVADLEARKQVNLLHNALDDEKAGKETKWLSLVGRSTSIPPIDNPLWDDIFELGSSILTRASLAPAPTKEDTKGEELFVDAEGLGASCVFYHFDDREFSDSARSEVTIAMDQPDHFSTRVLLVRDPDFAKVLLSQGCASGDLGQDQVQERAPVIQDSLPDAPSSTWNDIVPNTPAPLDRVATTASTEPEVIYEGWRQREAKGVPYYSLKTPKTVSDRPQLSKKAQDVLSLLQTKPRPRS